MAQKSILFVCLGNICRSPSAEGIMKSIVHVQNLDSKYRIDSAGIIGVHAGEPADSRMRRHASARGYNLTSISRQISVADFDMFDLIIGMDSQNLNDLHAIAQTDIHHSKIKRMTDFCTRINIDRVPDPYYGGAEGFEQVIDILEDACSGLLAELEK